MTATPDPSLEQTATDAPPQMERGRGRLEQGEPARSPTQTAPLPRRLVPVLIASSGAFLGPLEPLRKDTAR